MGKGEVGKTCIMKKLIDPTIDINQEEISTEGIDINNWYVKTKKSDDFRINFWDFGGQEIYHATHQFFLTKRSLYIFVWNARKDNDTTSFDYWLNIIDLLSDSSPILIVQNKVDQRNMPINSKQLKDKFPNIVGFHSVSASEGTGMEQLSNELKSTIAKLDHVGTRLPKVWNDIRLELEDINEDYISCDEYEEICNGHGLEVGDARILAQYYHDLGVILHFQNEPILKDIVILKPEWATNAVYKVIDTNEVIGNYGEFKYTDVEKIWKEYPSNKYDVLLELMKKFEICFQIPNTKMYIIPELLNPEKPEIEWDYGNNLRFEYVYKFMPAGIITRFIVRNQDMVKEAIYWKSGIVLEYENTEALIICEELKRKISIWIKGEDKKDLLAIIRREMNNIHDTLNKPDVKEMIPCICDECKEDAEPYFFEYFILKN